MRPILVGLSLIFAVAVCDGTWAGERQRQHRSHDGGGPKRGSMGAGPSFKTSAPANRRDDKRRGYSPRHEDKRELRNRDGGRHDDRRGRDGDRHHGRDRDRSHGGHGGRGDRDRHQSRHDRNGESHGAHDRHRFHGSNGSHGHRWHGDIRRFRHHDHHRWRHGSWHHGHRHGRSGWWWVVGPSWYFYPGPVYPYPNPYIPPAVVYETVVVDTSDYWYYCEHPEGYYPYVEACNQDWIRVPAQPDEAPPQSNY